MENYKSHGYLETMNNALFKKTPVTNSNVMQIYGEHANSYEEVTSPLYPPFKIITDTY